MWRKIGVTTFFLRLARGEPQHGDYRLAPTVGQ
jgi:hypothetical protein